MKLVWSLTHDDVLDELRRRGIRVEDLTRRELDLVAQHVDGALNSATDEVFETLVRHIQRAKVADEEDKKWRD